MRNLKDQSESNKKDIPNKTNRQKTIFIIWPLFFLLLMLLLAHFFWQQRSIQILSKEAHRQKTQILGAYEKIDEIKSQSQSKINDLRKQMDEQFTGKESLDPKSQTLFWLSLTQQYLAFQKKTFALNALEQAKNVAPQSALKVKIEKEIAALKQPETQEKNKIISALSKLNLAVFDLSLSHTLPLKSLERKAASIESQANFRDRIKQHTRNFFNSLFVLRHVSEKELIPETLDPFFLKQQLKLLIMQVQLDAFEGEEEEYQKHLDAITKLLERYFSGDKKTQAVLEQIKTLKKMKVKLTLPDLSYLIEMAEEEDISS
jgi:uncharacterized protein HemX